MQFLWLGSRYTFQSGTLIQEDFFLNYPRLADPVKIKNRQILKNPIPLDRILSSFHKKNADSQPTH